MLPAAQPLLPFHQAGGSGSPHGSGQAVPASAGHVSGPPERGGDRHRRQDARCGPDRDPDPVRTFNTFTDDLHRLADWFEQCGVKTVVMESTGVYWIPIYEILEQRGFAVSLVNARDAKHVPGRKSVTHNGCSVFMSAAEQLPAAGRDRDVAGLSASARAAAG
jgi:hypothetical protein